MRELADLRVVFMGTPEFAVPCLDALLDHGVSVVAVVTGVDKPAGRGQKIQPPPVKSRTVAAGLPVLQPENVRDPSFREGVQHYAADLFVVVAFRVLPAEIFRLPPLGTINVHASLLPKYRGAAPIQWAILRGEKETGITTFFINDNVDAGDVILQRRTPLGAMETAGELHDRLKHMGAEVLLETVKLVAKGEVPRLTQEGVATPAPKITRDMARINWARPAEEIVNLVRAMNPEPCAFTTLRDKLLLIHRAHQVEVAAPGYDDGTVVSARPGELLVATGAGVVAIDELQLQGRKRLPVAEFLRGFAVAGKERLH